MRDVNDAVRKIEEMKGNIVGLVLNDPENKADAHYTNYYNRYYRDARGKYYGESPEKHK